MTVARAADAATDTARELHRLAEADDGRPLAFLLVTPEAFTHSPQIGRPMTMQWSMVAAAFSRPIVGPSVEEQPNSDTAKACAGGYSVASYRDNVRRKSNLIAAHALVVDVDERGDVDALADRLSSYAAIIHDTFKSTRAAPRCRAILRLAEPVDAATYERAHAIVRAHLRAGFGVDDGAKDASRLSYFPVRRPGAGYKFRVTHGAALDARAVIAAQPPPPPRPPPAPPPRPEHRDAYIAGALRKASANIATAAPGERHGVLCREVYGLARHGLTEDEIKRVLLPAWVSAAGEARTQEGERTIRDAVRARGAA